VLCLRVFRHSRIGRGACRGHQSFKHELGGLRTGRAAASMLETGAGRCLRQPHAELNQLATISEPEHALSVQVWDKSMVRR